MRRGYDSPRLTDGSAADSTLRVAKEKEEKKKNRADLPLPATGSPGEPSEPPSPPLIDPRDSRRIEEARKRCRDYLCLLAFRLGRCGL